MLVAALDDQAMTRNDSGVGSDCAGGRCMSPLLSGLRVHAADAHAALGQGLGQLLLMMRVIRARWSSTHVIRVCWFEGSGS